MTLSDIPASKEDGDVFLSWQFEEKLWEQGLSLLAGIDEAGRGCLAGPVVASAVILPKHYSYPPSLNDSKKLNRATRKQIFEQLTSDPQVSYGIGSASVSEIDRFNILQASHMAMKRAVEALQPQPDFLLVDGLPVKLLGEKHLAIVKGDGKSPSIAAASVIAKEFRDRLMEQLHADYPVYGFDVHKGYGTKKHQEAIREHGISPHHRRSFDPVSQLTLL